MQQHFDPTTVDLQERLVAINRVAKVVKGGKNFRFSALVVVGDQNGHVGCGMGKAVEVPEAIRKAVEDAKKNMVSVNLVGTTIPHQTIGHFSRSNVLMIPASEGTGVIAGGPARAVIELAGIRNIRTKSLGSNNKQNVVFATLAALKEIKTPEEIARLRGKTVEEILA